MLDDGEALFLITTWFPFSLLLRGPSSPRTHPRVPRFTGDLIYLNAVGQPIVVINSHKVAVDLLDRRAATYSDRPSNVVACDIMSGGLLIGSARYGET